MPLVSEELKGRPFDDASRPYTTADEKAASLRGKVGLGRSQSAPTPPSTQQPQQPFGTNPGAPMDPQQQDAPPSSRDLGLGAKDAAAQLPDRQKPTYLRDFDSFSRENHAAGNNVRNYLGAVGGMVAHNLGEIGNYFRPLVPGQPSPQEMRQKGEHVTTTGEAVGAALGTVGAPFIATSGEIVAHHVENDPFMGQTYKDALAQYLPDDAQNPLVRWQVAHEVMDAHVSRLLRLGDDPAVSKDQRDAANIAAFGLIIERVAEYGGPQATRGAIRYATPAAKAAAAQMGKAAEAAVQAAPQAAGGFADLMGVRQAPRVTATSTGRPIDLGLGGPGGDALQGLTDTQLHAFLRLDGLADSDRAAAQGEVLRRGVITGGLTGRIGADPAKVARPADATAGPLGAQAVSNEQLAREAAIRRGEAAPSDVVPGETPKMMAKRPRPFSSSKAVRLPPGREAELAANPPDQVVAMAQEKIDLFVGKTAWPAELKDLVARSMTDRARAIQEKRRGLQPIEVTMAKARAKGIDIRELARMPEGVAGNAEQIASVFDTLYGPDGSSGVFAELKNLRSALEQVEQPTDAQQLRLLTKEFEVNVLTNTLMGLRAESGRGQRILRELYKIQRESGAGRLRDTYSRAIAAVGGKKNAEVLIRSLNKIASDPSLTEAERDIKYVQVLQGADHVPVGRKIEEAVVSFLVSNPLTHQAYIAGQVAQVYAEGLSQFPAAVADLAKTALHLQPERERTFSGALASLVGTHMAMKDASRYALQFLISEVRPRDIASLSETGVVGGYALEGWPGAVIRAPLRGVETYTVWFHEVGRAQSLWRQAGDAVALSGDSPTSRTFWSKAADLAKNPTPEMELVAERAGRQQSLRQQASGKIVEGIKTIRNAELPVIPGRWRPFFFVEPFVNITFAIAERGLEFSPLGFLRTMTTRGGEQSDAIGRAAVGTAVVTYFWQQALAGNITGEVPGDPKEREQFYAAGKKRVSFRTPDGAWHDYSRLEPIATSIKTISGIQDVLRSDEGKAMTPELAVSLTGRVAFSIGRSLATNNFTFGLKSLIDVFEKPGTDETVMGRVEMWLANQATEFDPFVGAQRALVSSTDPIARAPQNPLDHFKAVTPGLSQEVQAATDRWGTPRLRDPHEIKDLVNETIDSLDLGTTITVDGEEIPKTGISVGLTATDIARLKLSREEAQAYRTAAGTGVHNLLHDLFTDQRPIVGEDGRKRVWSAMDDRQKKAAVSETISAGRRAARVVVADAILLNAKTDDQVLRGAVMRLATISKVSDRADFLRGLETRGQLSDRLRRYLDDHRRQRERTVAEYLRTR